MRVWGHPFVIGELACGNLAGRNEFLGALAALPQVPVVDHADVLDFVEAYDLMGKGLGWIDAHLLASAMNQQIPLWTVDKRLATAAHTLGIEAPKLNRT